MKFLLKKKAYVVLNIKMEKNVTVLGRANSFKTHSFRDEGNSRGNDLSRFCNMNYHKVKIQFPLHVYESHSFQTAEATKPAKGTSQPSD